ncbi:MAG: efflux RND transporter periplasmic adaptor subunit [Anaerolineae bacterium]
MRRRTLCVIVGIVALAAVAAGLIWRSERQSALATEDLRSAVVERGDMLVVVSSSGHVRAAERVELSFPVSGRVAQIPIEVGDRVEAGETLARLDGERLSLEIERAKANLASAEARLTRLRRGTQTEEVEAVRANLRAAEARVSAAVAERDRLARGPGAAQIAAAEAEVASALTAQKKAEDWHETTLECRTFKISKGDPIKLPSGEVIPAPESIEREICPLLGAPEEQARYRLEAANEALEAARTRLQEMKDGASESQLRAVEANVTSAAANRDAARAQLEITLEGATDEQIAAAEAGVEQARSSVKQAELALEQTVLKAPFDGTVAAVDIAIGSQASAGLPVVTLVDASRFHVNVSVDEMEIGQLATGQTARLTFGALSNTVVTGTIERIAEDAGLDRGVITYDVRIDLVPTDAPIRVDMTTNATVVVDELNDVLKIPAWAVRVDRDTGGYFVHRRTGDGLERVDVRLGVRYEGVAQVLDGLSEGEEIVRIPESSPFSFGLTGSE